MRTIRANNFFCERIDGVAYFTVQFYLDGELRERREIYSGAPRGWDSPVYCINGEHVQVLFPWAPKEPGECEPFGVLIIPPQPAAQGQK